MNKVNKALFLSWLFEARCFFVHFWLTNSVMIMVRAIIFKWHKSKMIFLGARNRTIHYYHPMHEKITIFNKICGFLCNFENVGFTYQALLQLHCTVAWNTNLFLHIILKQNCHLNNSDKTSLFWNAVYMLTFMFMLSCPVNKCCSNCTLNSGNVQSI